MRLKFFKSNLAVTLIALLVFGGTVYSAVLPGVRAIWRAKTIGHVATSAGSVLAAVTDTGSQQTITTGIQALGVASRITATAGGDGTTAIKAIQVIIAGTDPNGVSITETLPAFTENTAGTVVGTKLFLTVTSVTIPAHDGTTVTTSIETGGSPALGGTDAVISEVTDTASQQTISAGSSINAIDVPRNITATVGGGASGIEAVQVIITGTNVEGATISETLPAFTENTAGTVVGSKIFKTVTSVTIPTHSGTTVTTAIGTGGTLGIDSRLKRNTARNAYLNETKETIDPTVSVDSTNIESNSFSINNALNSTPVIFEYMETPARN